MNNKNILQQMVDNGGNCVNLGRVIQNKHPDLDSWIKNLTEFLPEKCKYNERIFCVLNDITSRVLNGDGTTFSLFENLFEGYTIKKAPLPPKVLKGRAPKFTKIQRYINDNKTRNKHLYADGLIEGVDYVVCPHTKARLSMIKTNYITKVLEMTVEEYDALYPNTKKIADARIKNIKEGLQVLDEETGLTKHQLGIDKANITLKQVDETGVSGYKKLGRKTKATHMAKIDEHGRNGYQKQAYERVTTLTDNGLTVEENAHIKRKETILARNTGSTGGASMEATAALKPLLQFLDVNSIPYYYDNAEYVITDEDTGGCYYFDLTIPKFELAIEYQSSSWHANPTWDDCKWNNWGVPMGNKRTPEEVLEYDYNKARALFKFRGYVTYYVWADSVKNDVQELLCLLKTLNMKY